MNIITTTAELEALVERLSAAPFITIDTEFMRENTFWAQLCLVQVAGPDSDEAIIDPLSKDLSLDPLGPLLKNPKVLKVFHAARQDLEIFHHRFGFVPWPVFDTQVAAMVCGFGENVGYDRLVQAFTGKTIEKSARYTDWSRRPLSQGSLDYAIGDVTMLRAVYRGLGDQLEAKSRWQWLDQEMAVLSNPATYDQDPTKAWERLKMRSTKPRYVAMLKALAEWRDRAAQSRDLPRSRIVRDEALYEIASVMPKSAGELSRVRGVSEGLAKGKLGQEILDTVAVVAAIPNDQLPKIPRPKPGPTVPKPVVDLLKVLLRQVAQDSGVAPKLIADSDDLEALSTGQHEGLACLDGWRRELFGDQALELIAGKLALSARGDQLTVHRL